MTFSAESALKKHVQFLYGWIPELDRIGKYLAPATAQNNGLLCKLDTDGVTLAVGGDNDADFIMEQSCDTTGPIGSAAHRETYMQGFPQASVLCGTAITVVPIKSGATIWTDNIVTGTATGAIDGSTAINTEVEDYQGEWREFQSGGNARGKITKVIDSDGGVEILLYG